MSSDEQERHPLLADLTDRELVEEALLSSILANATAKVLMEMLVAHIIAERADEAGKSAILSFFETRRKEEVERMLGRLVGQDAQLGVMLAHLGIELQPPLPGEDQDDQAED